MVFVDPEEGPGTDDLFAAARSADGRPGLFLTRLGAAEFEPHRARRFFVHETSPQYGVDPPATPSLIGPPGRSPVLARTAVVALRSADRGAALARQGRHTSAARVLGRATRLLEARGHPAAAARCAQIRGWLALDRAQVARAIEAFEQARDICPESAESVSAAIGIGVAWIEDGRLAEAEAALRNAFLAARSLNDAAQAAAAAQSLARALYWQGRGDEASAALTDGFDGPLSRADRARLTMMSARIHLLDGAVTPAVRAARAAVQLATDADHGRMLPAAARVLGLGLLAAGDADGSREHLLAGLDAARRLHLPLAAVRLRLALLELAASIHDGSSIRRLVARLTTASARVPRLLRFQLRAACARASGAEIGHDVVAFVEASGAVTLTRERAASNPNAIAELEAFLALGHTASDDRSALDRMAEDLRQRLRAGTVLVAGALPERRILAATGRSWHGDPEIAWRTLTTGCSVVPDRQIEPREAAEPVRYGGQLIGAAICRWVAGTAVDTARAMALLRVGSLAMAPHVRALLDGHVPEGEASWKDLLGDSDATRTLRQSIVRAGRAPFPVLIEGESGSGKELVARALHRLSPRRDRRFCAINCAALSDDLLEAELFGHARGAFTGAIGERAGLFEEADGGTLFLDEIGELSARAQAKLLRVLQDGEVRRVGENVSRRIDVRIVAATNRRLEEETAAGRFRSDLRFRLDVVRIEVPPLRARASDVAILATHFWADAVARVGSHATLSTDVVAALTRYDWPGNVRELQNVIASMAVHSPRRGRVSSSALPAHLARVAAPTATTFEAAREEFERRFVKGALASANGHRMRAARSMGITRQGLAKMLRRLGLDGS
jgi:DNA-binding NtrC family response regulator/tetratricopeptide (TPR) repeat protein